MIFVILDPFIECPTLRLMELWIVIEQAETNGNLLCMATIVLLLFTVMLLVLRDIGTVNLSILFLCAFPPLFFP